MPDKARERFYIEALRQAVKDLPSGIPLEPEPPDFVFVQDGHRLGVELTTFHLAPDPGKQPHQEWHSLKDEIVASAERFHAETGGPPLYVGVIFHERERLRKRDVQPMARELAEAILRAEVPRHISEPPVVLRFSEKPRWSGGIHIHGSVNRADKLWHADAGGWVAKVEKEHIAAVVQIKATREPLARRECDELWLVIVNDNFSGAAQSEISDHARTALYKGPFKRLIWLLPHVPNAIELRLAA